MEKKIEGLRELLDRAEFIRDLAKEQEANGDMEGAKEDYAFAHMNKPFFEAVENIEQFDTIHLIVNDKYIYAVYPNDYYGYEFIFHKNIKDYIFLN